MICVATLISIICLTWILRLHEFLYSILLYSSLYGVATRLKHRHNCLNLFSRTVQPFARAENFHIFPHLVFSRPVSLWVDEWAQRENLFPVISRRSASCTFHGGALCFFLLISVGKIDFPPSYPAFTQIALRWAWRSSWKRNGERETVYRKKWTWKRESELRKSLKI